MITRAAAVVSLLMMVAAASGTAETLQALLSPNEEQSGSFGLSVSGAGDVDGDGCDDLVVGAPREDPGATPVNAGRAYVFSGMTGVLFHELASPNEVQGGLFGCAVAGVEDASDDGLPDILVGAQCENPSGSPEWAGRAYIISGQAGALLITLMSPNECHHGCFGAAVAAVGDVEGDGYSDVVVGAPGELVNHGGAYVFNGQSGALLCALSSPGERGDGRFGHSVSGVGDVDGDGSPEIAVGAPWEDPGSSPLGAGRAYVLSCLTGAPIHSFVSPNEEAFGYFGYSVSGSADVDQDGVRDIVIGAPFENPGDSPIDAGRAYVFSGESGELLHELTSPNETPGGQFGQAVAGVGDMNGDGYDDVAVGANRENPGDSPDYAGRAYIFSGQTGDQLYGLVSPNEEWLGYFGYSVAGAGDVNGDGRPDVMAGAYNEAPGGSPSWAGRAYVFSWMHLSSELVGGDLVLQWSPWSAATEYWIYGMANEPWFTPDLSPPTYVGRAAIVHPPTTVWSSPNGIGDPSANWTYLVMAVDATEQELTRSNRVGEEDFAGDIEESN
ncbi:MAG: integrin alpha [Candidatus Eisenbacteria bacterium]|jgi:hypothetical protein|nr:integrin alpha [Candidatus Eisenbacteria bacterium]